MKRNERNHSLLKQEQYADSAKGQPVSLQQALEIGVKLHSEGRLDEAENVYKQIHAAAPQEPNAIGFLGAIAHQRGNHQAAVELLEKSLRIEKNNAAALSNLGAAKLALGDAKAAIAHLTTALRLKPDHVNARYNMGNALLAAGQPAEALRAFQFVVKKNPGFARAHLGAGKAANALRQYPAATKHYRKALKQDPDAYDAHFGLISALVKMRAPREAVRACDEALARHPLVKKLHLAKADAFEMLGDDAKAIECYQTVLGIDPDDVAALNNLGNKHKNAIYPLKAIEYYERALAIDPSRTMIYGNLAGALARVGRLKESIATVKKVIDAEPDYLPSHTNLLYSLNHSAHTSAQMLFEAASAYGEIVERSNPPVTLIRKIRSAPPLRIGFMSADLRTHPVAYFLISLLDALDRQKLTLIAYSNNKTDDAITERLKKSFSVWRSVRTIDDDALARRIIDDEIDILVDLNGHTSETRLPVFARKPAPIQVSWLGYSGTTGLKTLDYVLCDPWEIPEEEEEYFTEKPWRLANTRHCYSEPEEPVHVGPLPAKENGYVTYGVFQRHSKITPEIIECFSAIINAAPGRRLAFRGHGFDELDVQTDVLAAFERFGVEKAQIIFLKRTSRESFFQNYNKVDIALSPFPWPGITTSCEGLWMGVPSVFLKGDRFLGRIGESITRNLDMSDWMGEDIDDYVRIAVEKASDIDALAALRAGLRERFLASPLCDAQLFARNLEDAFEKMAQRYRDQELARKQG